METFEREIFKALFESDTQVDIYLFHDEYLLSPGQIYAFFRKYGEINLIQLNGNYLTLTKAGREYVKENYKNIYLEQNKYWRDIPKDYIEDNKLDYSNAIKRLSQYEKNSLLAYK